MKAIFFVIFALISTFSFGQENDDFSKRLKAINNQTIVFYNVDGVDFSSQTFSNDLIWEGNFGIWASSGLTSTS